MLMFVSYSCLFVNDRLPPMRGISSRHLVGKRGNNENGGEFDEYEGPIGEQLIIENLQRILCYKFVLQTLKSEVSI